MKPLDNITVLDLTRLLPGAVATMMLGDFGADIIKIEEPGTGRPGAAIARGHQTTRSLLSGDQSQ